MRRQEGYGVWTDRVTGKTTELDTVQCRHCQRHIFVKPGTALTVYLVPTGHGWVEEAGAWCRSCNGAVCLSCHELGVCTHFMKQVEQAETETAMRDIRARLGHVIVPGHNG